MLTCHDFGSQVMTFFPEFTYFFILCLTSLAILVIMIYYLSFSVLSNLISLHFVDLILLGSTALIVCKITLRAILPTFWRYTFLPVIYVCALYAWHCYIIYHLVNCYSVASIGWLLCYPSIILRNCDLHMFSGIFTTP